MRPHVNHNGGMPQSPHLSVRRRFGVGPHAQSFSSSRPHAQSFSSGRRRRAQHTPCDVHSSTRPNLHAGACLSSRTRGSGATPTSELSPCPTPLPKSGEGAALCLSRRGGSSTSGSSRPSAERKRHAPFGVCTDPRPTRKASSVRPERRSMRAGGCAAQARSAGQRWAALAKSSCDFRNGGQLHSNAAPAHAFRRHLCGEAVVAVLGRREAARPRQRA